MEPVVIGLGIAVATFIVLLLAVLNSYSNLTQKYVSLQKINKESIFECTKLRKNCAELRAASREAAKRADAAVAELTDAVFELTDRKAANKSLAAALEKQSAEVSDLKRKIEQLQLTEAELRRQLSVQQLVKNKLKTLTGEPLAPTKPIVVPSGEDDGVIDAIAKLVAENLVDASGTVPPENSTDEKISEAIDSAVAKADKMIAEQEAAAGDSVPEAQIPVTTEVAAEATRMELHAEEKALEGDAVPVSQVTDSAVVATVSPEDFAAMNEAIDVVDKLNERIESSVLTMQSHMGVVEAAKAGKEQSDANEAK